jgi:putative hydrolase of the HAD superfamily
MRLMNLHKRFIDLSKPMELVPTDDSSKLKLLDNIYLIAYDFYGTLFISGAGDIGVDDGLINSGTLQEVLQDAGISIMSKKAASEALRLYNHVVEDYIKNAVAAGIEYPEPDIRSIWQSVLSALRKNKLIQFRESSTIYELVSIEFEARMNPVWPVPGIVKTLKYFHQRGIKQGIISNSQFYTPIVLEALTGYSLHELGLSEELLHWSYEEKMKKPDLLFYKRFLKKALNSFPDIKPGNMLYIGNDMLKDVYPAQTLGMKTALFAGDKRSLKWRRDDDRCSGIEPDLIITNFSQLHECVAGSYPG